MWHRALKASLVLVFCALAAHPPVAEAKSLYGTFTEIYSADLLELRHDAGTYTVRIYGVDAPEAGEPFALEAKLLTRALVMSGSEHRVRIKERNERGEMVAMVLVDGQDVGLALVRAGLAKRVPDVHYKLTSNDQPDALVLAEDEARLAHRGVWKGGPPAADGKAAGLVPEAAGAVRGGGTTDRNTSQKNGVDNECAVAQDPSNTNRLFKACNTSTAGLFAAMSSDGGATWTYPDPTDKTIADGDAGQGASACCDPTLAWDTFGNLYVTYLGSGATVQTLLSTDGGATFSALVTFSGSVDQPTVVAANVTGGVAVWIVWNQSGSMVARGALATGLGTVGAFNALQTAPSTSGCSFGDIAIAPSGLVIQVCEQPSGGQGPANIRMNVDADGLGPGGWSAVSTATSTNVGGFDFIPAQNDRSVDAEAGLAYDANPSSPHFGRLYLVYSEEVVPEAHDLETMVRFSDDNGTTWSAPIRVNDDATTRSQFMPKIASDLQTGNIGICWHDCRNSASNTAMEMVCSTADTSGASPSFTANVQMGDGASTSPGIDIEFGDYMGLAFQGGVIHAVWADTSNSTGDNPNGTSSFDAYTDSLVVGELVFADGFETGDVAAWTLCSGGGCPP